MPSLPVTLPEIPARRAGFRGAPMDLVQSRIVTDDVEQLAAFYARLVRVSVVLNDYYVEVPAGAASVAFSRRRFTEYQENQAARPCCPRHQAEIMLDFKSRDVDAEYQRISPGTAGAAPYRREKWRWYRP